MNVISFEGQCVKKALPNQGPIIWDVLHALLQTFCRPTNPIFAEAILKSRISKSSNRHDRAVFASSISD